MPRRTHPRSRHRHDRAHIRFHRDRVVAKRWKQAKRHIGGYRISDLHPEAIYRENIDGAEGWPFNRGWGMLEDEQYWMGCHRARCGLCNWERLDPWRTREKRKWREIEDAAW